MYAAREAGIVELHPVFVDKLPIVDADHIDELFPFDRHVHRVERITVDSCQFVLPSQELFDDVLVFVQHLPIQSAACFILLA